MFRTGDRDGRDDEHAGGDGHGTPARRTLTSAIQRKAAPAAAASGSDSAEGPAPTGPLDDPFDFTFGGSAALAAEEAEGDRDNNDADPEPPPRQPAGGARAAGAGGDDTEAGLDEDEPSADGAEQEEEEQISDVELAAEVSAEDGDAPGEAAPGGPPAQARAGGGGLDRGADLPASSGGAPLEPGLRGSMERSFQSDFSSVQLHAESPRAAALGALAYTEGDAVHVAPGQYNPGSQTGRELIGHELAHVVQQREGRVSATGQAKGLALNEDASLEHEADEQGRRAAAGEVAYRSTGLAMRGQVAAVQMSRPVLQLLRSHWGSFSANPYHSMRKKGKGVGVEIVVKFRGNRHVDARQIAMVQAVRSADKGSPVTNVNPMVAARSISSGDARAMPSAVGTDEGFHIDQSQTNRNPLYAVEGAPATDTRLDQGPTPSPATRMTRAERRQRAQATGVAGQTFKGWGDHGYHYKDNGRWKAKPATLHDVPKLPSRTANAEQIFETTALATDGAQNGTYYGSVQWGWRTDARGRFRRLPFRMLSQGVPTSTFMKAAEIWNPGTTDATSGSMPNLALPVVDVHVLTQRTRLNPGLRGRRHTRLRRGTRVEVLDRAVAVPDGRTLARVRIVDGSRTGVEGLVDPTLLQDER